MGQSDTVENILNAAEALFAERGFAETSLRTITSTAGVNLAAVNYHFGSKKELIHAVFARFLTPFCQQLELQMQQLSAADKADLDILLSQLYQVAFEHLNEVNPHNPGQFMKLLGLAYSQGQGHLRSYLKANYGDVYLVIAEQLRAATPIRDDAEFHWRLHFILGAAIFALSGHEAISAIAQEEYGVEESLRSTINRLVPVTVAMLKAPQDGQQ